VAISSALPATQASADEPGVQAVTRREAILTTELAIVLLLLAAAMILIVALPFTGHHQRQ
jgi:hypothetical protein